MSNKKLNKLGFTIVELLVVIVVIGILAAITIVSYSGISSKAIVASLQSDLDNDSRQLKLYYVEYGYYPNTLDSNKCPNTPTVDTRYCLKASGDTALAYTGGGQAFKLTATKNSVSYRISEGQSPFLVSATPVTAIAGTTGTPQVGQTLTAGAMTPAGATATYQWQSAATSGGTYTNISGATSNTYALTSNELLKYVRVVATGTGDYTNSQVSSAVRAIDSNWLTIGAQTWAKANSNVGTMITGVTAQTNNSTLEKYCYSNSEANCTTYGGFYQWDEAMQYVTTEGAQGICSAGSHIPSDAEIKTLEMSLSGMTQATADTVGFRGTDEGTKLKSGGASGLNVQLSGVRNTTGTFSSLSSGATLWSSSESGANAWNRTVASSLATVARYATDAKTYGYSVRCVAN